MKPLLVYLDSSDYSLLSDPKRSTTETQEIISKLKNWIDSEAIICCYSGIHLHEMAPIDAIYSDAAELRANLMVELCKRNSLISNEKIFRSELAQLLGISSTAIEPLSRNGEWYSDGIPEMITEAKVDMDSILNEVISESGMNRSQRRLAKRNATKGLKAKNALKHSMIAEGRHGSIQEQLAKYPMREQDMRVLARFVSGDATMYEASEAFAESLRDPRWMIRWFKNHYKDLNPFIDRLRTPMASTIESIKKLAVIINFANEQAKQNGEIKKQIEINKKIWEQNSNEMILNLAKKLSQQFGEKYSEKITLASVDENCPSLSVGVRALCSAWYSALLPNTARAPSNSDFPDALHAMYAPYVDIFRADAFMAPIVKKETRRFRVKVVAKLVELPDTIEFLINERRAFT